MAPPKSESGDPVDDVPVLPGRYRSTATSASAGTANSTQSLRSSAPGGMLKLVLPLKVSVLLEPATMFAFAPRSAICAPPTLSDPVP